MSISRLLGQVRKRGLNRTLAARDLPLSRREMSRAVSVGAEVLTIMSEACAFAPLQVAFPDERAAGAMPALDLVDEHELIAGLNAALPVQDLLRWLRARYAHLNDATLLRLYHELVARPGWQALQDDTPTTVPLNTVQVILYQHAIMNQ